jgi:hypothetical protein
MMGAQSEGPCAGVERELLKTSWRRSFQNLRCEAELGRQGRQRRVVLNKENSMESQGC